jgi:hypothetical protein
VVFSPRSREGPASLFNPGRLGFVVVVVVVVICAFWSSCMTLRSVYSPRKCIKQAQFNTHSLSGFTNNDISLCSRRHESK